MGPARFSGRYLSGLCAATLGLCAAGWLALAPVAFGYRNASPHDAALTDRATGVGLAVVSLVTLVCWVVAWRRKLRADGILAGTSRRQARREARAQSRRERGGEPATRIPDPAQVLSELRALLIPLLAEPPNGQAADVQAAVPRTVGVPQPGNEPEPGEPDGGWPDPHHDEPGCRATAEPDYYQRVGYAPAPAEPGARPPALAVPAARSGGLAAMESMLAGAELLMVGCGEEEAW
jgi:hypothetical protein